MYVYNLSVGVKVRSIASLYPGDIVLSGVYSGLLHRHVNLSTRQHKKHIANCLRANYCASFIENNESWPCIHGSK